VAGVIQTLTTSEEAGGPGQRCEKKATCQGPRATAPAEGAEPPAKKINRDGSGIRVPQTQPWQSNQAENEFALPQAL